MENANVEVFGKSAGRLASYGTGAWETFVCLMSDAVVAGLVTWNAEARDGKGSWKRGCLKSMIEAAKAAAAERGHDVENMPYMTVTAASLVGNGIRKHAPAIFETEDADNRHELCELFAAKWTQNSLGRDLSDKDDEQTEDTEQTAASLESMVANLFAWAAKNNIAETDVKAAVAAFGGE